MGFYHSVKCKTPNCKNWLVGERVDTSNLPSNFSIIDSKLTGQIQCTDCGEVHVYRLKDVDLKKWPNLP